MIPVQAMIYWGRAALSLGTRLSRYALRFLWWLCQPKAVLVARLLALQSQLAACKDRIERRLNGRKGRALGSVAEVSAMLLGGGGVRSGSSLDDRPRARASASPGGPNGPGPKAKR